MNAICYWTTVSTGGASRIPTISPATCRAITLRKKRNRFRSSTASRRRWKRAPRAAKRYRTVLPHDKLTVRRWTGGYRRIHRTRLVSGYSISNIALRWSACTAFLRILSHVSKQAKEKNTVQNCNILLLRVSNSFDTIKQFLYNNVSKGVHQNHELVLVRKF